MRLTECFVILDNYLPFYPLTPVQRAEFFSHFGPFLPFYHPNDPKIQSFEKTKNRPGDIILHMCTINKNHMMYVSGDMECDRQNFLSFWTSFCLFYPHNNPKKDKILKKWKIAWRYYHFTHVYHKWQSYDVWFLRYGAWRTELLVIFGPFFAF